MSKRMYGMLVLGCAVAIACSGCRTKKPQTTGTDLGPLTPLDEGTNTLVTGDKPLSGRFDEDMTRVTDATFDAVMFRYDSFQIDSAETMKIEKVAQYMKGNAAVRLVVEGNCDERGSNEYNMSLGENRAMAVRAYLIGLGIGGDTIQTKSYGEEKPVDPGHTESAWVKNRRCEFALYK